MANHVATATVEIDAPPARVWTALTDPAEIEKYMFGSHVVTDWKPGSSIVWKGEYEGKRYEDKGEIVEIKPARRLKVTHFSPLSGQEDVPENYHTLTYELEAAGPYDSRGAEPGQQSRPRKPRSTRRRTGRRCSPRSRRSSRRAE